MEDLFSSSTSSDLITVNSSDPNCTNALLETSDDELDPALRDLMDERKRLVAELVASGEIAPDDVDQFTEDLMDNGAAVVESNEMDYVFKTPNVDADEEYDVLSDSDYDEDEVDKLLDESLANGKSSIPSSDAATPDEKFKGLSQPPAVKTKVVLKHRGMEYFEVLPDGWIEVTHSSGVPVFLHKSTRVCTFSRPYFIGPGSVRNHDIPVSAVPCYYQRKLKELDKEKKRKLEESDSDSSMPEKKLKFDKDDDMSNFETDPINASTPSSKANGTNFPRTPNVKVQTVDDFKKQNMSPHQLFEYCSSAFEFESINVMRFKSWSDHRMYRRRQKQEHQMSSTPAHTTASPQRHCPMKNGNVSNIDAISRPSLPANVKLITVPDMEKSTKPQQKPFFLNPQGRTSIAVLHEYVQKVMKGSVSYEFSETRNAANPYCAVVRIATNDRNRSGSSANTTDESGGNKAGHELVWTEYGKGEGNSKKNAKLNAAKQAMRVLVPGIEFNADGIADLPEQDDAGKLFDMIKITDSRVPELSAKAGQPTPFVILQECLKRHSSFGDTTIEMDIKRIKHQQHEFTMKVAKHEAKVHCTNKKEGKQRAAQSMLEKLHPQITSWGSLIRMYGYGAQRKLQETRKEKDSIIRLQVQNKQQNFGDEPNMAILDKLKQEMQKLYEQGKANEGDGFSEAGCSHTMSAVKNIDI